VHIAVLILDRALAAEADQLAHGAGDLRIGEQRGELHDHGGIAADLHVDGLALGIGVGAARRGGAKPTLPVAAVCAFSAFQPASGAGNSAANASAFFCPINCEARSSDCLALPRSPDW